MTSFVLQTTLATGLFLFLTLAPLNSEAAPGATAAGPNDLDRFRHASPPQERAPTSLSSEVAAKFKLLVAQGESALKSNKHEEAIARFSAALQLKPPKDAALVVIRLRSDAHIEQGDLDKALADANEMIRLDAQHFRGYQVRGRVYRRKGEVDRAIGDYNMALQLNPTFAQLYNNRGVAFSQKDQERRAIQDFNEAIRLAPRVIDGYVNRGASYYALGDFPKALADYDEAIRLQPQDPDAYFNRGATYEKMGDLRKAITQYSEAMKRNPRDPDIYEALAAAYGQIGEFDQAVKYQMLAMSVKGVPPKTLKKMQEHLHHYQQHKPWRDESKLRRAHS